MFSPEAIKNKIIPYAIPWIPWDKYMDTVGFMVVSFQRNRRDANARRSGIPAIF